MPIGRERNYFLCYVVHLVLFHLLLELDMELSEGLSGSFIYAESGSVLMVIVLIYTRI